MSEYQSTAILVGMFVLRCIAPLVITLAIGYLMNRLVDRWEAEDLARSKGELPAESTAWPRPDIKLPTVTIPCWLLRNCDPAARAECPAQNQPGIPCWLVRLRADGTLPETCPHCPIYTRSTTVMA